MKEAIHPVKRCIHNSDDTCFPSRQDGLFVGFSGVLIISHTIGPFLHLLTDRGDGLQNLC